MPYFACICNAVVQGDFVKTQPIADSTPAMLRSILPPELSIFFVAVLMIALGMGGPSEQIDGKSGDCTFGSSGSLACRAKVVGLSSGERSG
jgi:hypothetical protein